MRRIRAWFLRIAGLSRKEATDRELAAEMGAILSCTSTTTCRAGMNAEEARRQALVKLGGIEQSEERYRDRKGLPMIETFLQDLRFATRVYARISESQPSSL